MELPPNVARDVYNEKKRRFLEGIDKLEKDTNLKLTPALVVTSQGILPTLQLIPKEDSVLKDNIIKK